MKVCLMADIHGFLPEYDQDTDLLVLAGDVEPTNRDDEFAKQLLAWRGNRASMIIPGNHDPYDGKLDSVIANYKGVMIWASPITVGNPKDRPHVMSDEIAASYYGSMPRGIDIAVVHSPPYGYLDDYDGEHIGSKSLLEVVMRQGPRYLVCGHVHNRNGEIKLKNTTVINAAMCGFPEKKTVYPPHYIYL